GSLKINAANYLGEGQDDQAKATMRESAQDLPSRILGIMPKNKVWYLMRPMLNDYGMRAINAAKFWSGKRGQTRNEPYKQPHAAFAFLLDYVPDWKKAYGPEGLIQYQTFVPKEAASDVHPRLLERCHKRHIVPYLGVYKRHRTDPFLMTHAVDGFSFAMDFRVTSSNRNELWQLCRDMDDIVTEAGGRLYFAKDATMLPRTAEAIWGKETIERFHALKRRLDPKSRLQTNLARRVFPDWFAS
ncbi:MAG: FAD-binding oxidoreductase, partial [Planctomycetes bacterium]|nr:FAD-binding oxidoreductase [Planctomycetota bacterium]